MEPEHFDDADEVDDDEPSGGREEWDYDWELGEDNE